MLESDGITNRDETALRQRRRGAIALAGVVLASLVASGALAVQPASAKKPPPRFYGVVPQTALEAGDFSELQRDRVGIVRQLFLWPEIEPSPGQYDWSSTDETIRQASAAGIEVFPVLYGVPAWAQSEKLNSRCGVTCGPSTPEARQGFARFAAAAVARYGPGGSFFTEPPPPPPEQPPSDPCTVPPLLCKRGGLGDKPIEVWQIWNEQNSPKYYGPKVNVRQFAGLVKQASKAIRAQDPKAEVVLGGMWGPPGTDAVVPTVRYLERLYRVAGSRSTFDSIAVHPYAGRLASVKGQLRGIRRLAVQVGDRNVGLWVTELGWASSGPKGEPLVKTRSMQAALLRKSFRFLIGKRVAWRIRSVHWYSWRDTDNAAAICAWCPRSGLRTSGGGDKPAANAFRNLPRSGG